MFDFLKDNCFFNSVFYHSQVLEPYLVPWQRPLLKTFVKENHPKFFALAQKYGMFHEIKRQKEYTLFIPATNIYENINMVISGIPF